MQSSRNGQHYWLDVLCERNNFSELKDSLMRNVKTVTGTQDFCPDEMLDNKSMGLRIEELEVVCYGPSLSGSYKRLDTRVMVKGIEDFIVSARSPWLDAMYALQGRFLGAITVTDEDV